jgi:uncharacterized protein
MTVSAKNKPLIAQGWLRALLFFITFIITVSLVSSALVLLINLPGFAGKNAQEIQTILANPPYVYIIISATAVVSLLLVLLFRRLLDRQSMISLGFSFHQNGASAAIGFLTGLFILCAGTLFLYFNKNLQWTDVSFSATDLFTSAVGMLIVAVTEELVFRGYLLNNLLQSMNKWVALVLTSLLFAIMHGTNPNISVIALLNIFIAGLLLGINYIYTNNLWYAILLHFTWNFLQGPVLGYEVSGVNLESILHQQLEGNPLLTGGVFGFEGSIVATVLTAACFTTYAIVYSKKYKPVPAGSLQIE